MLSFDVRCLLLLYCRAVPSACVVLWGVMFVMCVFVVGCVFV